MFGRSDTETAGNARLHGVTYVVTVDTPLRGRPRYARVTVEADDGRRRSFLFPDDQPYLTGAEAVALGLENPEALRPDVRPEVA